MSGFRALAAVMALVVLQTDAVPMTPKQMSMTAADDATQLMFTKETKYFVDDLSADYFDYEEVTPPVGGPYGGPFQTDLKRCRMIRSLTFWESDRMITGVRVEYFDSAKDHMHTNEWGRLHGAMMCDKFEFSPGEMVTDIRMNERRDSGALGERLGEVCITTTNQPRRCCGEGDNNDYYHRGAPGGASYLAGIYGKAGHEIDRMGFIFWKQIKETSIIKIDFNTDHAQLANSQPDELRTYYFNCCGTNGFNPPDECARSVSQTTKYELTTGKKSCFNFAQKFSFEKTMKISAEIPKLGGSSLETKWGFGFEAGQDICTDTIEKITVETKVEAPPLQPGERRTMQYTQSVLTARSVEFTADMEITFADRRQVRLTGLSGKFDGMQPQTVTFTETREDC